MGIEQFYTISSDFEVILLVSSRWFFRCQNVQPTHAYKRQLVISIFRTLYTESQRCICVIKINQVQKHWRIIAASHFVENVIETFKACMPSIRRGALLYLSARNNFLLKCEIYWNVLFMVHWSFAIWRRPCNLHKLNSRKNDAHNAIKTALSAWVSQFVHNLYQKARWNVKNLCHRDLRQMTNYGW